MHSCADSAFRLRMARPLQVSLLGGSLASLGLRFLEDISRVGTPSLDFCPECPALINPFEGKIQLDSLVLGILIGLLLGPVVDLLYLFRVWWISFVREQVRLLNTRPPLYRVL